MNDPMLSDSPEEREKYSKGIMDTMRQAIEEDRAARRSQKPRDESPATLIGATGFGNGITRAL